MTKINTKYLFMFFVLVMIFAIGVVSATENTTTSQSLDDYSIQEQSTNAEILEENTIKENILPKSNIKNDGESDEVAYISPEATLEGDGSRNNPYNISVAFNNTNIQNKKNFTLLEGEYNLKKAVTITKSYAKDILIQSEGNVTINGLNKINLFDIKTDNTVTINNISFINAYSESNNGAAIINAGNLTIVNSSFYNNIASSGGAIYNNKGNLTIMNSIFDHNQATGSGTNGYGGAIHSTGNISFMNSIFTNNNASKGGALYNNKVIFNIDSDNLFENNSADWAGSIYNYQATLIINKNNTFKSSSAKNYAGVVYNDRGNVTIKQNNTFLNNNGFSFGGVISSNLGNILIENDNQFINNTATYGGVINSTGNITINENNTFDANKANYAGASVYTNRGNLIVNPENVFINNNANSYGGSIYLWNAKANVSGSIFKNNLAQDGGCIYINTNCTDLIFNNLEFENNSATTGGVFNTKVLTTITNSKFNSNTATTGASIYAQDYLIVGSCNFTDGNADEGGAIYATGDSTTQITRSNFKDITSNNETLNLQGENTFIENNYENVSILYDNLTLQVNNPKEVYATTDSIELEVISVLTNPTYYDGNILDKDEYTYYINNQEIIRTSDNVYNLTIDTEGTYSISASSKLLGNTNIIENIQVGTDTPGDVTVNNLKVSSNSGNLLVNEENIISIDVTNTLRDNIPLTITIDNYSYTSQASLGESVINITYMPQGNGEKSISVSIDDGVSFIYEDSLVAYYNGYMGKSFTNGQNITTKRHYTGKNTVVIIPIKFYLSNNYGEEQFTFNSADYGITERNKIVDVLYYQGYNWLKDTGYMFIGLNEEGLWDPISDYTDTKGFGSYDYPSGLSVFDAKGQFIANGQNQLDILPESNDRSVYGGYFIVIYANNTDETDIIINEGADLLNPESSGYGANSSNTIAYANYENINADDAILYTISAAADKAGESKIMVNNKEYGSLADNYDSTSRISIVESNLDNLVNGTNLVSLQSINDNLLVMNTILMITHPAMPNVVVDDVDVTASKGDLLVETDNTITIKLTNDGGAATATLNITIDDKNITETVENFTGETTIDVTYNPATTGAKNIKIDIINDETTQTLYEGTINAYYNGYRGKSFTGGENFTTKRQYEGKNTLILEQFNYYNWNESTKATYDATQLSSDKIVDVLYYQGYNWDKNLNFGLNVNDEESPIIANYSDTKGFGTYNYPSGVVVFNITEQFKAGQLNEIVPIQLENNSNILYGGILVIIYANNTETTSILINEGADLLNPEASGLTTNEYTIAYSNYENIKSADAMLYTISAAADKVGESKIIVNNKEYQSLADNYDSTSKISIIETNLDNLEDGTNLVSLQSINDNLFAMGTILVVNHPLELSLKVDTTAFTIGTTTNISASIYDGENILTGINKGKVVFKVNGKTLKDENGKVIYAKVVNGTATITGYEIPASWNENSTIQAIYSGSVEVSSLTSDKQTLSITQDSVTITTEDIVTKAGTDITLKATINTNVAINNGKVIFKINGKTVKDENGKIIYAKVSNNAVSVDYTLPENFKVGEYNITAIFISSVYGNLEDVKTLTVTV
ncbi:DUF3344 domain-containing protein [Methanosphaera sp. BMS]|uniref:DUF3344 domain-containing protein n=1 Tax=Methanosphaera sp. BMS TaxID=1789762 RepID=UPI000DC1C360|nr:DUF3344 domain-containing protein [Methanosphaera sp. BMS]AWX32591.1 hypothetical protein AW729_05530 [Methanosphaera sp. BMS]